MKLGSVARRLPVLIVVAFSAGLPCKAADQTPVTFGRVLLHAGPESSPTDLKAAYADYLQLTAK